MSTTQTMTRLLDSLQSHARLLIEAELAPVMGDRFQPTGFADLGAAQYETPDGRQMLLVESAQSMANRLEHACLDGDGPRIAPELQGLPYVVARLSGESDAETSSLVEAHRLNSPFIISDEGFQKRFVDLSGYTKGKVIDWKKVARAMFHYDPSSLIHGVFMANLGDGRVRVPRALTGFIEASNVREAVSGGVKNNPLDPTGTIRAKGYDKDVYGNVPYHRTEYTAQSIQAMFNLDLALVRGFRLPEAAQELLVALALYKVRSFLEGGLRLRTACDLCLKGDVRVRPESFRLPDRGDLLSHVQELIRECAREALFADPAVTEIQTVTVKKTSKDAEEE
ncbi:MAG: type I-U CRISPR-associated RAMP protein Csb1/Cas7u [Candidatus Eremiobacterota bacterium]